MVSVQNDDGYGVPRKVQQSHGQFIGKIISYIQKRNSQKANSVPFEYVDLWVPSFVTPESEGQQCGFEDQKCRLCFAGCGTVDPSSFEKSHNNGFYNLLSFGEYSQKFSFGVGCGLPGRVYQSGIPTWEQSVHNAPVQHFERCSGALQYGVKTVVGIPIPSPNVGCIVVALYSCLDRPKDQNLVGQLSEEFTSYIPSPKWKLVVDVASDIASHSQPYNNNSKMASNNIQQNYASNEQEKRINEIIYLLGEHMPSDPSSPLAAYAQFYMSLRLMLLKNVRSDQETEWIRILLGSYSSYASADRSYHDIAVLLARDFMFLQQQSQQSSTPQQHPNAMHLQQQNSMQVMQNSMQQCQVAQMRQSNTNPSHFSAPLQQSNIQFLPMSSPQQPHQLTRDGISTRASFEAPRTLITE